MAKADKEKRKKDVELPDGFTSANPIGEGIWWKPKTGEVVRGKMLGVFQRNKVNKQGKRGWFFQIELTAPANGVKGRKDEKEEVEAKPGDIISVDMREGLKGLYPIAKDAGAKYEVYIKAVEKIDLDEGNTFWRFAVGHRVISGKPNPTAVVPEEPKGERAPYGADEDIPF